MDHPQKPLPLATEVDQLQAVVIDCGSYWTRAGFNRSDAPSAVFRSIVGRSKFSCCIMGLSQPPKQWYIGQEAIDRQGILKLRHSFDTDDLTADPMSIDDAEVIFSHVFTELKAADLASTTGADAGYDSTVGQSSLYIDGPVRHPVLLTESVSNQARSRQRITQVMFETYGVPSLQTASRPALCLLDAGLTTGLVIQSGHRATRVVPICEGRVIRNAVQLSEIAGRYITDTLMRNLAEREQRSTASAPCSGSDGIHGEAASRAVAGSRRDLINNIKEKYCYVLADSQEWATSGGPMQQVKGRVDDTDVVLDGNPVRLGDERFLCAESLFRSDSLDRLTNQEPSGTSSAASIPEMVTNSISRCADDIRELGLTFSNIVTVGGTSLLPGFDQRLRGEVCGVLAGKLRIDASRVNLITSCSRQNSAWNGGSALAASLACTEQWVSRELYDEYGPEVIDDRLLVCM